MRSSLVSEGIFGANTTADIWYNKWAGGDREDSYSKYVALRAIMVAGLITK